MEQHPVPQNVTTFQFRLIGDMTVKQFGYLAGGLITAYVCYKLPLPFFFTWPLALTTGLLGFGFAFVPVEERPMDVWVLSFIKNIYNPTQYIWQKQKKQGGGDVKHLVHQETGTIAQTVTPQATQERANGFFSLRTATPPVPAPAATRTPHSSTHAQGRTRLISEWIVDPFGWFTAFKNAMTPNPKTPPTPPGVFATNATSSLTGTRPDLTQPPQPHQAQDLVPSAENQAQKAALEQELLSLQSQLATRQSNDVSLKRLQEQVATILSEKTKIEEELLRLRRQVSSKPIQQSPFIRQASMAQNTTASPTVRVVTSDMAPHVGLPKLTTFPNIITGILKDSDGNLLSGVLVTVRDTNDVPVRALKANKLGQFAASTPLPNGTYVIEIEDPRNQFYFDRIQVTLTGDLLPAVEVTAKNQKQMEREKLAQQIFGNQTV